MYDFLGGARLIALPKENVDDVRPIAMGSTIRKLTGRVMLVKAADDIRRLLHPLQLGVATPSGCETVLHYCRSVLAVRPDWYILRLDVRNAYNTIFRAEILQQVKEHFPYMFPFVKAIYSGRPKLWVEVLEELQSALRSKEGTQQGDVLASLLYALALHPVLRRIYEAAQPLQGLVLAIMDDVTVVGPFEACVAALHVAMELLPSIGQELRLSKCELYGPSPLLLEQRARLPTQL
ncbi:MAG: hypothetical protein EBZ67_15200, partial [Chitinophagia bacterium]|nr:hypothetical protein [Chitinophagia bacterium]